jgi:hypothetical protein
MCGRTGRRALYVRVSGIRVRRHALLDSECCIIQLAVAVIWSM